jgi:hypothetical protein
VQSHCTCCTKYRHQSEFLNQKEETHVEFELENGSNLMDHENDLVLWVCVWAHAHFCINIHSHHKQTKAFYMVCKFITKDSTLMMIIRGEFIAIQNLGSHILKEGHNRKQLWHSVIHVFIVVWKRSGIAVPLNVNVIGGDNKEPKICASYTYFLTNLHVTGDGLWLIDYVYMLFTPWLHSYCQFLTD